MKSLRKRVPLLMTQNAAVPRMTPLLLAVPPMITAVNAKNVSVEQTARG
jgi:hypothetical protein